MVIMCLHHLFYSYNHLGVHHLLWNWDVSEHIDNKYPLSFAQQGGSPVAQNLCFKQTGLCALLHELQGTGCEVIPGIKIKIPISPYCNNYCKVLVNKVILCV